MKSKNNMPLKANKIHIFPNHIGGNTTIIYRNWVKNSDDLFCANNRNDFFSSHEVKTEYQNDIEDALAGRAKPLTISDVSNLDDKLKLELADFAYKFCSNEGFDQNVLDLLMATENTHVAIDFCNDIEMSADVRQEILAKLREKIINTQDAESAYWYCVLISTNNEMRQVIIDSGDDNWARKYYLFVQKHPAVRSVIKSREMS